MSPTLLSFDHEQTPFSAETGQKSITARTCTCDPSLTSKTCNPLQDVCQPAGLQRQSDGLHPKPECKDGAISRAIPEGIMDRQEWIDHFGNDLGFNAHDIGDDGTI